MRCAPGDPFAPHSAGWRDPWNFATVQATIERLDRAGFTAIDVWLEAAPTTLPDRDTYREFLWTVCVCEHVARLPKDLRPPFLDVCRAGRRDSPPFTLDYRRLNIYARKLAGIEQAA